MIPRGDRSGAIIEPYLTDQWYVRVGPLAQQARLAVAQGRVRFVPENWTRTYFDWMDRIEDWCISRQLWWGHQIPAWYGPDGQIFVARSASEAQAQALAHYGAPTPIERDPDVLDTWFSSALWPFSTLGWPRETPELQTFYPTNVLVTGFDIIFFWVARMIMMGLHFTGEVPFREVYVHGLILDGEGQKMSKSKGNVLDPLDLIDGISADQLVEKRTQGLLQPHMAEKIAKATRKEFPQGIPAFGTDALRFTFAALATQGRDIRFDLKRVEGNRNFCNKVWNAARFALLQMAAHDELAGATELLTPERWIIGRLQETASAVNEALDQYRFADAAQSLYHFLWDDYCDWYIELAKPILRDDSPFSEAARRGTRRTLLAVLEAALRLAHPFVPFLSETLWQRLAPLLDKSGPSIALAPYPKADLNRIDPKANADMDWLKGFVSAIRSIRGEMDIPASRPLPILLQGGTVVDQERLASLSTWLNTLARIDHIQYLAGGEEAPPAALQLLGDLQIRVPLAGLIDITAEQERLQKEEGKLGSELDKVRSRLAQPSFRERAPAAVVQREEQRVQELEAALSEIQKQRSQLDLLQ